MRRKKEPQQLPPFLLSLSPHFFLIILVSDLKAADAALYVELMHRYYCSCAILRKEEEEHMLCLRKSVHIANLILTNQNSNDNKLKNE